MTSGMVQAIDAVPAANLPTFTEPVKVGAAGFGLLFAMCPPDVLSDVKARQAVLYALDYDKICKGRHDKAGDLLPPGGTLAYKKANGLPKDLGQYRPLG